MFSKTCFRSHFAFINAAFCHPTTVDAIGLSATLRSEPRSVTVTPCTTADRAGQMMYSQGENKKPPHIISTLDPEKLLETDYVDLSLTRTFTTPDAKTLSGGPARWRLFYPGFFRPETLGFLYLWRPPAWAPRGAVALRFRLADKPTRAGFAAGTDLRRGGVPWAVPLVYGVLWDDVVQQLLTAPPKDGGKALVSFAEDDTLWELRRGVTWANPARPYPSQSPLLHARNQPFILNLSNPKFRLLLLGRRKSESGEEEEFIQKTWIPAPTAHWGELIAGLGRKQRKEKGWSRERQRMEFKQLPTLYSGACPGPSLYQRACVACLT